ncbi:uncharacterized protein LOC124454370 [Xenia sp. Carnegie-2017]|uniref:uncharacterized protein LOC124454370 n=1 Tax=Xenia sp. Carnegie-2017 TaxID=2897299 RepID=UPI001F042754|nr:uncharacterized protein LOC124454370 [Xenia sp. Carnegie-2017]
MQFLLYQVLFSILIVTVKKCQSQSSQAQPCLVCGDAVLRIWSFMTGPGDKYLRITNQDNANDKIVDCGGDLENNNFTSLLKIGEKSTLQETRIQLLFELGGQQYHLYTKSLNEPLLAMTSSTAASLTDNSNLWAPERLLYEHQLFTVFQSVKFRGYYLSCDGKGVVRLQQVINVAYRSPEQLFITIDPGNAIRAISFRGSRRKREISENEESFDRFDASPGRKKFQLWKKRRRTPPTKEPSTVGSVMRTFKLPTNITFVLCFWLRTTDRFAQLISISEERTRFQIVVKKIKNPRYHYWYRRHPYYAHHYPRYIYKRFKKTIKTNETIVNVTILEQKLHIEIGYSRRSWTLPNMDIADGQYRHICISLNEQNSLQVYRNSEVILNETVFGLVFDFGNNTSKRNLTERSGILTLGLVQGISMQNFQGSLVQVNLWDQYPPFRIRRIATNCACGGGSLVSWSEILSATMVDDVDIDFQTQCPSLQGYDYNTLIQNRLI